MTRGRGEIVGTIAERLLSLGLAETPYATAVLAET
jgi:hypothetical protein